MDGVGDWLLDVSLVDGRWIWSAETDHTGLDESGVAATREEAIAAAEAVVERAAAATKPGIACGTCGVEFKPERTDETAIGVDVLLRCSNGHAHTLTVLGVRSAGVGAHRVPAQS